MASEESYVMYLKLCQELYIAPMKTKEKDEKRKPGVKADSEIIFSYSK